MLIGFWINRNPSLKRRREKVEYYRGLTALREQVERSDPYVHSGVLHLCGVRQLLICETVACKFCIHYLQVKNTYKGSRILRYLIHSASLSLSKFEGLPIPGLYSPFVFIKTYEGKPLHENISINSVMIFLST
jgi:hypothetical protein